jgi:ribosomal protein S18 acetylase RimI-like enzyme
MRYRVLERKDVEDVVDIHRDAFKGFFLTSLGRGFLRLYYTSCIASEESIAIGVWNEKDQMVGFSVGSQLSKGFHKRMIKRNLLSFVWMGTILFFKNPKNIKRLLNNLGKNAGPEDTGEYAELLSIGVRPETKGKGYGKYCLECFEEELSKTDAKEVALTTDFHDNDGVIQFYKSKGYKIFYKFVAYPDREMLKMKKNLKE